MAGKKRGAVEGQLVVYVLAVTVIILVFIYGYNAIRDFDEKTDKISLIQFERDLQTAIDSVSADFGSSIVRELELPDLNDQLCFAELGVANSNYMGADYPIISNSIGSGAMMNIFIRKKGQTEHMFYIKEVDVTETGHDKPGFICFNDTAGRLKIRFEGLGNRTEIKRP